MYTLAKAPSKFAVSARRGPPRSLDFDTYETRDKSSIKASSSPPDETPEMSNPKPIFQQRRSLNRKPLPTSNNQPDNVVAPNHDEMARLLLGQWKKVEDGLNKKEPLWEMYREKECDKSLDDFQAFDLEKYWGNRTLKSVLGKPS